MVVYPNITSTMTGSAVKTATGNQNQNQLVCNTPYILVGADCCLDQNHNAICDKDEPATTTVTATTTTSSASCSTPYIKIGTRCCLDDNRNRVCDQDEDYYNDGYTYSTKRADIDDPFHISSIDLYRDYITMELRNEGDEDYVIKNIDIDDCGSKKFDRQIDEDERKSFTIYCDDDDITRINSDFTVKYTTVGGNVTQTAEGTVRITLVPSSDYKDYYDY